ncbi:MAG: AAA family ATPase [Chloroflexi bacterium]|nr:AAA family ATPase [Chloroflexota bacterium]
MTTTIAIAGKGGSGKTTIAALLIKLLSRKGTVLAIDADPATNLNLVLGLPLSDTVGKVREDMAARVKARTMDPSLSKQDYLDMKISEALVESPQIDLLAMGRPEGAGCYCAANNMIRTCIDRLGKNYDYVVIDCEAGLEHISRQTTRDIDIMLLVSDLTVRGIFTAANMKALIGDLRTGAGKIYLVVNRASGPLPPRIARTIEDAALQIIELVPEDRVIRGLEAEGTPLIELPPGSELQIAVLEIARKLGLL